MEHMFGGGASEPFSPTKGRVQTVEGEGCVKDVRRLKKRGAREKDARKKRERCEEEERNVPNKIK